MHRVVLCAAAMCAVSALVGFSQSVPVSASVRECALLGFAIALTLLAGAAETVGDGETAKTEVAD